MTAAPDFIVDFVAHGNTDDEWRMVLVEQGPWNPPFANELLRLQDRLYNSIEAALGGQLAAKFPESHGKRIVVQLDGYRLPAAEVHAFFHPFAAGALATDEYRHALASCLFVSAISFELNLNWPQLT